MKKIDSIRDLHRRGMNTHEMVITNNLSEAVAAAKAYGEFTVRTDGAPGWGDGSDLPFFVHTGSWDPTGHFKELLEEGLWLIISNGIKYDPIQNYNAVASISKNGDYHIELSARKVPLRHMYRYPTYGAVGNLCDGLWGADWFGTPCFDRKEVLDDLLTLYAHGVFDKEIEFTTYPIPVGVKKEPMVFCIMTPSYVCTPCNQ